MSLTLGIVSVGTELLLAQTRDTNFPHLAARAREAGFRVVTHATVPDDLFAMIAALRDAAARADVVVTIGGLGPTVDDRTRDALVAVTGRPLSRDDATLEAIRERLRARRIVMSPLNEVQALVPRGAEILPNANGTAPGLWLEHEGTVFVCLPGPPREFEPLVDAALLPRLIARGGGPARTHVTFHTVGLGESVLAQRLVAHHDLLLRHEVAYLPHFGLVDVRVTFDGRDAARDAADLLAIRAAMNAAAGAALFAEGDRTLEQTIGDLLRARGWSIATGESCTGGRVVARLIAPPGASDYVRGGVVAYSNEAKTALLDVPEDLIASDGAVSESVALAMARGARARVGAEVGVSSTGIAGPTGARPGKPVGLVFLAVSSPHGDVGERHEFAGGRDEVTARATLRALDLARRAVMGRGAA